MRLKTSIECIFVLSLCLVGSQFSHYFLSDLLSVFVFIVVINIRDIHHAFTEDLISIAKKSNKEDPYDLN